MISPYKDNRTLFFQYFIQLFFLVKYSASLVLIRTAAVAKVIAVTSREIHLKKWL